MKLQYLTSTKILKEVIIHSPQWCSDTLSKDLGFICAEPNRALRSSLICHVTLCQIQCTASRKYRSVYLTTIYLQDDLIERCSFAAGKNIHSNGLYLAVNRVSLRVHEAKAEISYNGFQSQPWKLKSLATAEGWICLEMHLRTF